MHLHDQTFWVAGRWFAQQSKEMRDDVLTHYGNLPEPEVNYYQLPNGPTWLWWLLIILPLQPCHQVFTNYTHEMSRPIFFSINAISPQIQVLAMTSLKQRLKVLEKVLKLAGRQDRN